MPIANKDAAVLRLKGAPEIGYFNGVASLRVFLALKKNAFSTSFVYWGGLSEFFF